MVNGPSFAGLSSDSLTPTGVLLEFSESHFALI